MHVDLRPYRDSDFEGMFTITREIVSRPPYDEARHELSRYPNKSTLAFVGSLDGRVVGFCAASHPHWNRVAILDYLVVARDQRRQGLGTKLVTQLEAAAHAAALRRLCVQTISWNTDAVRFYERLGFTRLAAFEGYFDDDHVMVWFDKALA